MVVQTLNPAWGANYPYDDEGYPLGLRNLDLWSGPPGSGVSGLPGATPGAPSIGYPSVGLPSHNWGPWHAGGSPSGPIIGAPGTSLTTMPAPSPAASAMGPNLPPPGQGGGPWSNMPVQPVAPAVPGPLANTPLPPSRPRDRTGKIDPKAVNLGYGAPFTQVARPNADPTNPRGGGAPQMGMLDLSQLFKRRQA